MKILFTLFVFIFSIFVYTNTVEARLVAERAKILPQAAKASKSTSAVKATGSGITVSPRLRADRRAVVVYFSNLQNAKSVSYALTYSTSEQEEGAMGTLNLNNLKSTSVELLFGTCSKNACRYHTNITNMKLEVSYTSTSGKKYIKRFRIKV